MLLEKVAKFWYKTGRNFDNKNLDQIETNLIRMLFKSRDEKRIFGIMNFQKKSRNGNEKRIFKEFDAFGKMYRQVLVQIGRNSGPPPFFLENWH